MKKILKKILTDLLKFFSLLVLKKYRPEVIGVTGSVGKTSTKEAIYTVLSGKFKVRRNQKNYNNELGVPLTILGLESGGRNILKWLVNIFRALSLIFVWHPYPKILVLEMGADRKNDIKYLTDFVKCKIGVITAVAPVHLEFFGSLENIVKEKQILVKTLEKDDWAILNRDNELVWEMHDKVKAQICSFGFDEQADVRAMDFFVSSGEDQIEAIAGISFKLNYQGTTLPIHLPGVLGRPQIYASLAAVTVGLIYEMNLVEIAQSLKKYKSPKGRMNIIPGIKGATILDDTYNSSPDAAIAALEVLKDLPGKGKKFAAFGEMLELGEFSEKGHYRAGKNAVAAGVDYLITVGERARDFGRGAKKAGMPEENIFHFTNLREAGIFLQNRIKTNDIILVKGSQGSRMEKVVKEIMAEPERASELLVRQDKSWQ